mmetsp:Transcript_83624/g.194425  ORF Transcript_83624/g.194425 Transcript_83624/m.194425 type:complete len:236 (-) Transcript_83624:33-740(-)
MFARPRSLVQSTFLRHCTSTPAASGASPPVQCPVAHALSAWPLRSPVQQWAGLLRRPMAASGGQTLHWLPNSLAAARWGEGWLSASIAAHLVLVGEPGRAEASTRQSELRSTGNAVETVYEVLTEHLSLARVSVVSGGAAALHKEATKRGLRLKAEAAGQPREGRSSLTSAARAGLQAASGTPNSVSGRLGGLFRSGADAAAALAGTAARGAATVRQQAAEGMGAARQPRRRPEA